VYDAQTLQMVKSIEGKFHACSSVAIAPDGQSVAIAEFKDIYLWRADRSVLLLQGHTGEIQSLSFSSYGALLASVDEDGMLRIWRMADGAYLHTLKTGNDDAVLAFRRTADDQRGTLLTRSGDTVRLRQANNGKPIAD
jgi:WD40 repeat protein